VCHLQMQNIYDIQFKDVMKRSSRAIDIYAAPRRRFLRPPPAKSSSDAMYVFLRERNSASSSGCKRTSPKRQKQHAACKQRHMPNLLLRPTRGAASGKQRPHEGVGALAEPTRSAAFNAVSAAKRERESASCGRRD
jgi:hypothetical protein